MNTGVMIITTTLLVLLFLKLPVFVAVLGASAVYFVLTPGINSAVFAQQVIIRVESVILLAIPFFVYAGVLMNYTGVTKRVMDSCAVLADRVCGELSQVNILLNTLMGGLSGSTLADTATEVKILVLETERKGIGRVFSTVVTAVSSMITPLIPPGIELILYGCIINISIGKLFVAGFDPGILFYATMVFMVSRVPKERGCLPLRTERIHPSMFWKSFRSVVLLLCLLIIITSGARLGVLTITEVGSAAIVYIVILGIAYRESRFKEIVQGLRETLQATSSVILIATATPTFSWILTKETIPQRPTEWMIQMIDNKWIFLVVVDIFLIFVGMFVEGNVNMIVLIPLFVSAVTAYGIDPIYFAMVFIFVNTIGAFTPPMGTLMFVACGVAKCPARDSIKETASFYAFLFGHPLTLTFVSLFSTGLADLVY